MPEEIAEHLARKIAARALEFQAYEFEPVRFCAAKSFDGKREALFGMIRDGQDAARQIVIFRPEVQQRFLSGPSDFPGQSRKGRDSSSVLANFDAAGGGEFLEAGLQFGGEVHARNYK